MSIANWLANTDQHWETTLVAYESGAKDSSSQTIFGAHQFWSDGPPKRVCRTIFLYLSAGSAQYLAPGAHCKQTVTLLEPQFEFRHWRLLVLEQTVPPINADNAPHLHSTLVCLFLPVTDRTERRHFNTNNHWPNNTLTFLHCNSTQHYSNIGQNPFIIWHLYQFTLQIAPNKSQILFYTPQNQIIISKS